MDTKHLDALLSKLPNGIAADPALDLKLLKESHDALVEALESVLAALDEANGDPRHPEAIKARAALALTKGGQP